MNICVIPARGGSKRIKNKNIKDFCGKPIIKYSIDAAIKSESFDEVIVSTDDEEIAELALKSGANVPSLRPKHLSDDHTGLIPVIKHAIESLCENDFEIKSVCCLLATCPFVSKDIILEVMRKYDSSDCDYCFTASEFDYPIERAFTLSKSNNVKMISPESYKLRSQDCLKTFHDTGMLYWGRKNAWLQEVQIFSDNSTFYKLPRELSIDIDDMDDWHHAELMYDFLSSIKPKNK
jgi:N-acylneuraminate cytidylyltransferase